MGYRPEMTDMSGNAPEPDQKLAQEVEPPGSGIDGHIHPDEPAEGPE
jgi:hypothetical protein